MGGSEDDEKPKMNGKFCKTKVFSHTVIRVMHKVFWILSHLRINKIHMGTQAEFEASGKLGDGTVKSLVRAGKDGEFIQGSPKK